MASKMTAVAWIAGGLMVAGAAAAPAAAQNNGVLALVGDWAGILPGQPPTHVVVHVRPAADGVTATYDNLDRGVRGVPLSDFRRNGDEVSFALPAAGIHYEGRLESDGRTLTGGIAQGANLPQPAILTRTGE